MLLIIILLIVINDAIVLGSIYFLNSSKAKNIDVKDNNTLSIENSNSDMNVDIKGLVKKPGVYKVDSNMMVNDVINLAGGLKKNATTQNINLSKKVFDQMVIIISSENDYKKSQKNSNTKQKNDALITYEESALITTDNSSTNSKVSELVNINTATIEELLTVSGIGNSKAEAIISYRKNNKFNSIEDIKNVTGIGDALFEKIKDSITV